MAQQSWMNWNHIRKELIAMWSIVNKNFRYTRMAGNNLSSGPGMSGSSVSASTIRL
jgi:hypothetical protein